MDTGNDDSLMPISIFKNLFHKAAMPHLEVCIMTIKHKDKQRLCRVFIFPRHSPPLLEMQDIKLLDILSMKCSTIDPQTEVRDINAKTNINEQYKENNPRQTKTQALIQ